MTCGSCCHITTSTVDGWEVFNLVLAGIFVFAMMFVFRRLFKSYTRALKKSTYTTLMDNWNTIGTTAGSSEPMLQTYYVWLSAMAMYFMFEALLILAPGDSDVVSACHSLLWCFHALMDQFPWIFMLQKDSSTRSIVRAISVAMLFVVGKLALLLNTSHFVNCTWCSTFFPEPNSLYELTFFGVLYATIWIAHTVFRLNGRQLGRGQMIVWVRYLAVIYGMAAIGSAVVVEGGHDGGYCFLIVPVLLYALLYAPVMLTVFEEDSKEVLHMLSIRRQKTQLAPLLGANAAMTIDPGELDLGERVGAGGYGVVHKASWVGTEVAVKRLLGMWHVADDPAQVSLVKEIGTMSLMRHPNTCQFMGLSVVQQDIWIVMEFMERGSLFDILYKGDDELTWARVLPILRDAARGMAYLHTRSPVIIHRDLKSGNLLIGSDWRCKVADFGIARPKNATERYTNVGSVHWAAPEVIRCEAYNELADVYSFGIIMWEVVARCHPYENLGHIAVANFVGYGGGRPVVPAACPPAYAALMQRCWHPDAAERPSMADVLRELTALDEAALTPSLRAVQRTATGQVDASAINATLGSTPRAGAAGYETSSTASSLLPDGTPASATH